MFPRHLRNDYDTRKSESEVKDGHTEWDKQKNSINSVQQQQYCLPVVLMAIQHADCSAALEPPTREAAEDAQQRKGQVFDDISRGLRTVHTAVTHGQMRQILARQTTCYSYAADFSPDKQPATRTPGMQIIIYNNSSRAYSVLEVVQPVKMAYPPCSPVGLLRAGVYRVQLRCTSQVDNYVARVGKLALLLRRPSGVRCFSVMKCVLCFSSKPRIVRCLVHVQNIHTGISYIHKN